MAFTTHLIGRFIGLGKRPPENGGMRVDLGFRVGTSSRRVTKYSLPSKPGVGPRYIVVGKNDHCLVVEDMLHRQLQFLGWLGPAAKIINSVTAAIDALRTEAFQWLFLDRDGLVGGYGEDVAAEVVRLKLTNCKVVCHSTNTFGAALIEKTLRDGGISNIEVAPFDILGVIRETQSRGKA